MTPLPAALDRVWASVELPGYREHPELTTYSGFAYEDLPPPGRALDAELRWLVAEPPVPSSLADVHPADPPPARPATATQLAHLVTESSVVLPSAFRRFIEDDEPRKRIRSATACYLDLGEFLVPVAGGGHLVHFLSDQQWVLHWLLYADPAGSETVIVTPEPIGFEEYGRSFDPVRSDAAHCAASFSEFLYRFWIENEIWFALEEDRPLSAAEQACVDHYAALGR